MAVFGELDLPLEEVLKRYKEGPSSGLFTDGSARPNPGPGGWGAVLVRDGKVIKHDYGFEEETTNNRMELTGLIAGFRMIEGNEPITVYTDSELCVNSMTKWAASWKKNGWKRKSGPIANLELVQQLYELCLAKPNAQLKWVKAHNGWLWNEYADSLATAWAREIL